MNTPSKIGAFALGLLALIGAGNLVGNLVGPINTDNASSHSAAGGHNMASMTNNPNDTPGGLMVSDSGYTLKLTSSRALAGKETPVAFQVIGKNGKPLTRYARLHDKELHFIVVKRDLSGFQHLHPTRADDGTWTTPVALTPGLWRAFADFDPAGNDEPKTLGADLSVAGNFEPQALPEASVRADVDSYEVTLQGGLRAGKDSKLVLSVTKQGRPVTDLEPYLSAFGHLVALRDGDLAYLHVHPAGEPGDGNTEPGPGITFHANAPSDGRYRLFLDFKHQGIVRTAAFTVNVDSHAAPSASDKSNDASESDRDAHQH